MPTRKLTLTAEIAKNRITEKLRKAGTKGVAAFTTAKTAAEQRAVYEQALEEMIASGSVVRISAGAKPKYFAGEVAPSAERAAAKMEQYAALKHPVLLAQAGFAKALTPVEKPLLGEALQWLLSRLQLIPLSTGTKAVYAHAGSVRKLLGSAPMPIAPTPSKALEPQSVREAYRSLAQRTGFPDVEISALRDESGAPLAELKKWLLAEHAQGRADFYLGDWSLASEGERAAAVELRDERYLLVRLEG